MFVHDLRVLNIGCSITAIKPHSGDLLQEKMMCDPKERKKRKKTFKRFKYDRNKICRTQTDGRSRRRGGASINKSNSHYFAKTSETLKKKSASV